MNHSRRRLQSISDAVLAIAATVLAVPLVKIDETVRLDMYLRGKPLKDVLKSDYQLESFAMFLGSFLLVYLVWVRHGRQFTRLSREEAAGEIPALMITNMLELFLATLLPYTAASASRARLTTEGEAEDRRFLALPFCANILALATTRVVFESLALRARPSIGTGFFNLCEAAGELAGSMLVMALASSVLVGEEVFLPFLAVPFISAIVHVVLIQCYGEPEHSKMDWHRLESFVDCVLAVVSTLMVLNIKPPVDCQDMRIETCVLNFEAGCRLKFEPDSLFKPPKCYFGRTESQLRDVALIFMYLICFCLMFFLWYSHHEVVWFGYAPQPKRPSETPDGFILVSSIKSEGNARATTLTAWFCASLGLFPFAFSLVAEFTLQPYAEVHDPRLFPQFEAPLDSHASRTACAFALGVLISSSLPLALLLIVAPKRRLVPFGVYFRILAYPLVAGINLGLLAANPDVKLWPLFAIVPIIASSNVLEVLMEAKCVRSTRMEMIQENSTNNTPVIVQNPNILVAPGISSEYLLLGNGNGNHVNGDISDTSAPPPPPSLGRRTSASADAEYYSQFM